MISPSFTTFRIMTIVVAILLCNTVIFIHAYEFEYIRSETTIIEYTQDVLLAMMFSIAFISGAFKQKWRELMWLIAAVALMMLIREQNNWFKSQVFRGAWEICVLMVLLPSGYWLYKNSQNLKAQLKHFSILPGVPSGVIGLTILLIFSRLLGMKQIWKNAMGDNYMYGIKMMMEESMELLGYSLMLAGLMNLCIAIVFNKVSETES